MSSVTTIDNNNTSSSAHNSRWSIPSGWCITDIVNNMVYKDDDTDGWSGWSDDDTDGQQDFLDQLYEWDFLKPSYNYDLQCEQTHSTMANKEYTKPHSKQLKLNKTKKYAKYTQHGCPCGCVSPARATIEGKRDNRKTRMDLRNSTRRLNKGTSDEIYLPQKNYTHRMGSKFNYMGIIARYHHISFNEVRKKFLGSGRHGFTRTLRSCGNLLLSVHLG